MSILRKAALAVLATAAVAVFTPAVSAAAPAGAQGTERAIQQDTMTLEDAKQRAKVSGAPVRVTEPGVSRIVRLHNFLQFTCLDLYNSTGPAIWHWPCNGQNNQRWYFFGVGQSWEISPYQDRADCVDVERRVGPNLLRFDCNGQDNQRWEWWTDGVVYWFSPESNRNTCLDAELNGTRALAWPCNGQANQHWTTFA
jgi:hypothetical protein